MKRQFPVLKRPAQIASWIVPLIAAATQLQTLRFKFTGVPEWVNIFEAVGQEPIERQGRGVGERVAAILLLVAAPRMVWRAPRA